MKSSDLLKELTLQTHDFIQWAEALREQPPARLMWKPAATSWSVLECLQHLNLYGDYYLPAMEEAIGKSSSAPEELFKPGWLGNYFANSMLPKEKLNKMSTFKNMNPIHKETDLAALEGFIHQQHRMLGILKKAESVSLNSIRITITISSLIRLKLGDTLRFNVNHTIRHLRQADRVLNACPE